MELMKYLRNNLDDDYNPENFEAKVFKKVESNLFELRVKIESKAEDFISKAHEAASEYFAIKTYSAFVSYFIISRN
jgi:hypothetical protein